LRIEKKANKNLTKFLINRYSKSIDFQKLIMMVLNEIVNIPELK